MLHIVQVVFAGRAETPQVFLDQPEAEAAYVAQVNRCWKQSYAAYCDRSGIAAGRFASAKAFLETLETILDRAQAGEPVWDWDQESVIDDLLGVDEPLAVPSDAVSVVELDKPVPPVRLVVPRPAVEAPLVIEDVATEAEPVEEAVSIEDLAAELSDEDIAPLDLPVGMDAIADPPAATEVEVVDTAAVVDEFDPDAVTLETDAADAAVDEAGAEECFEAVEDADEVAPAIEDAPAKANGKSGSKAAKANAPAETVESEPADVEEAPVNSLEALMRRRGLSAVSQVEEVEVTDRGGRG